MPTLDNNFKNSYRFLSKTTQLRLILMLNSHHLSSWVDLI